MRVLICGVTGQDGAFLAKHILDARCEVWGTSRDGARGDLSRLSALGIAGLVGLHAMNPVDKSSVSGVLDAVGPTTIINLAGQTSVALSFEQPCEAISSSAIATVNILEWIRVRSPKTRLINAGSGDCFGDTCDTPAIEDSRFDPRSPYAVGKCAAAELVRLYRVAYGVHSATAYLFNHESPLRPERFVTRKVVDAVCAILAGTMRTKLTLGRLDMIRDWGWAPEYMEALWGMALLPKAEDFIIATGSSQSLETFVATVFAEGGLDWSEHVVSRVELHRPLDINVSRATPARARERLGWFARTRGEDVPRRLFREIAQGTHGIP